MAAVASFLGVGTINATPNSGHLTIVLKPLKQRSASAQDIVTRLAKKLDAPCRRGIAVHMQPAQDIQIGARISRTQYQYTLTDLDGAELSDWTKRLLAKLKALPMLTDVASDQQNGGLKADIQIDRDQASRLGISAAGHRRYALRRLRPAPDFNRLFAGQPVPCHPGRPRRFQQTRRCRGFMCAASGLVPLGAPSPKSASLPAPLAITHQGEFPAVTVSFNLAAGKSLGDAITAIDQAEKELGMPDTIVGDYSGEAAEFRSSLTSEPLLILAAIIVIYIVLGVLYESTIHPVTILSTLPSAGVGALLALTLTGQDLSLVALIGIVLLMGIVKKNAIMMIDFALAAEREQGLSPQDSIFQACMLRFRPIMMTTMAALLGAIPLAFDQGMGSELRRPLGITIVGGLLLSQLLTLYTTPVIYLYMERVKVYMRERFHPQEAIR